MDIKLLQDTLRRAAGTLRAAKAKPQAQAVSSIAELIEASGDTSVEAFIKKSSDALADADMSRLSATEIFSKLREAGTDRDKFSSIINALENRSVDKSKAIEVAIMYIGLRKANWPSKPLALKAIKEKFDERAFLEAKALHNQRVTPY